VDLPGARPLARVALPTVNTPAELAVAGDPAEE